MQADTSHVVRAIVVIDDDPLHLRILNRQITNAMAIISPDAAPPKILQHTDARSAMDSLPDAGLCVILCDYDMPSGDGLTWLPKLVHADVGPVFLLTSHGTERIAAEAFRLGAADYLVKDEIIADPARFGQMIADGVRSYRLQQINYRLQRQLKQVTIELAHRNQRLTELSETAHRFVDDVAHDFRTPLTIVYEYASIIADGLDGPVNDRQHRHLRVILAAAKEMGQMVEDFLDSSRLRVHAVRMDRRIHEVRQIIEPAVEMIAVQAESHGVSVETEIDPSVGPVYADAAKARRVLINLAVNAIKVSPEGATLRIVANTRTDGDVQIEVIDQGPGLSPDQQRRIFERFKQSEEIATHSSEGLGLGLSIATQLARLNLGHIGLASELDHGSAFSFSLSTPDLRRVLGNFLRHIVTLGIEGDAAALHVLPSSPAQTPDDDNASLRAWLASVSPAVDLVLNHDDGGVLVIGVWEDPADRIEAIQQAAAKNDRRGSENRIGPLKIQLAGRWTRNTTEAKLIAAMHGCIERITADVAKTDSAGG